MDVIISPAADDFVPNCFDLIKKCIFSDDRVVVADFIKALHFLILSHMLRNNSSIVFFVIDGSR